MMPSLPDRGYGASKTAGFFIFGLFSWILPACGIIEASNLFVLLVLTSICLVAYAAYVHQLVPRQELANVIKSHAFGVEGIFLGLSLIFATIRYLNPEIFWGEKPMDATFLNFFTRSEALPPQDPWASGHLMSYYYIGVYYLAVLLKLTGIPVAVGFNICISVLPGFVGSSLYSLFLALTRSAWFAVVSAFVVVLSSDPEVLRLFIVEGKPANFDTFWASTRVFTSPHFFEYTSWSFLFADLHAHVIAIPFTVLLVVMGIAIFLDAHHRYSIHGAALRIGAGLLWGELFGMNTWDFITYGAVLGTLLVAARVPWFWRPPANPETGVIPLREKLLASFVARGSGLVWDGLLVVLPALVMVSLYAGDSGAKQPVHWGWVTGEEFNTLGQLLRTLGFWMILNLFGWVVMIWSRLSKGHYWRCTQLILGMVFIFIALAIPLLSLKAGISQHPWGLFVYATLGVLAAWLLLWCADIVDLSNELRATAILAFFAAFLMIVLENLFLIDRMNTLFKGYMAIWMLASCSSMVVAFVALKEFWRSSGLLAKGSLVAVPVVIIGVSLLGTVINMRSVIVTQRVPERFYTLDGLAYVDYASPEDAKLIRWINRNVRGTPILLEAQGDSYREYTRISMNTGLPTVLGWLYHVQQRGLPGDEAEMRRRAIRAIYMTDDIELTKKLLLQYNIDLVAVGEIESRDYRGAGIAKFDEHPEIFYPLYRDGGTRLYATYLSTLQPAYKQYLGKP